MLRVNILATKPISFSQNPAIVYIGKDTLINTIGGYAPYSITYVRDELVYENIDKYTGEIELKGKKLSSSSIRVEDKYGQTATLSYQVKDSILETDISELRLAPGETKYITVTNYVAGVKQLFRNNNNIQTYLESYIENNQRVYIVAVKALYSGSSQISFKDLKEPYNNEKGISIIVTGNTQNPNFEAFHHPDAIDACPKGDYSGSTKDGKCGTPPSNDEPTKEENEDTPSTDISDTELDTLLSELFAEFGIESVESGEGVEVNSEYQLTDSIRSRVDVIVKGWISSKGENKVLEIQKYIPTIKKKYNKEHINILMDYVSESIDKQINIKVIHSVQNISNGEIGGLEFQVNSNLQSKISNIGVKFTNEFGQTEKQELAMRADGKYIVAFSQDSCANCKDLKPYYLLSGRTDIFISSNENNIEVANSSYSQFVNILKSIWNWRGYDKEYNRGKQKIIDIKEDIRGEIINIILQEIAKNASNGVEIGSININTLPVAGYMLDKFLNGPHNTESFSNEHWISKKFKLSSDYQNILNLIQIKSFDYSSLENGDEKIFISNSDGFEFQIVPLLQLDLYMAVASYNYYLSIFKENDIFYTRVIFEDEYDFEPDQYGFTTYEGENLLSIIKKNLSNNLNYLGNYHEKELSGTPYYWKVEIINELK